MCLKYFLSFLSAFFLLSFYSLVLKAQENIEKSQLLGEEVYARLDKTKKEYEEALATGDSLEVAEVCYRMGKRYLSFGDYYTAEKWLTRSLRIREPLGPSEDIGKVYIFMTDYLIANRQYEEAMQLLKKALMNFHSANSKQGLISGYTCLSDLHLLGLELRQNQPTKYPKYSLDSALYYYNQAEKLTRNIHKTNGIENINVFKGISMLRKGNIYQYIDKTLAIKYIKEANNIFLQEKYGHGLIFTSFKLGDIYFSLNKFFEAKKWLDKCIYIVNTSKAGNYGQRIKLFKIYGELNKKTGNYKEALKYQEQYYELTLQGLNKDRDGAVSRLKIEYDTQKKEAELKEQEKFTKIAIAIGSFALLTSIVFFWFFRKYRILSKQNEALVSEQNHRVKNNLQQVTNLLSLQSNRLHDETAKRAVNDALLRIEAVSLVHHRLYDGERLIEIDLSTFIPELTEGILRSYGYHDVHPDYQIDNLWLHVEQTLPLGLIINELVTNACKYAFPENPNPALVIHCHEKDEAIVLTVSDNGVGFDQSTKKKTFGLKLIQIFTERLKGKSGFENEGSVFNLTFQKQALKTKKNPSTSKLNTT